jgi:hypothetical protein
MLAFDDDFSRRKRESDIVENNYLYMCPVVPVFVQSFPVK